MSPFAPGFVALVCRAPTIPVSVNKHSFRASPCPAVQQQKLLSSPWFGALRANTPMCNHLFSFSGGVFFCRRRRCLHQSYVSKGIWRQGIGSFAMNSQVSTLRPVVTCPYLCTPGGERSKYIQYTVYVCIYVYIYIYIYIYRHGNVLIIFFSGFHRRVL